VAPQVSSAMSQAHSPDDVALALIQGLEARKFLISLAPGTRTRLQQMAAAELAPRSDRLELR